VLAFKNQNLRMKKLQPILYSVKTRDFYDKGLQYMLEIDRTYSIKEIGELKTM